MVNHQYGYPVIIAKSVATDKHFYDLTPLEFGIFDRKTSSVATNIGRGKEFFLAFGGPHTRDQITKYLKSGKAPKKSEFFLGKEIHSFEKAYPQRPEGEEWVIGYGGGEDDTTLKFECGKSYQFLVHLEGEPAFQLLNQTVERMITYNTPCCDVPANCTENCDDTLLDVKEHTIKLAQTIMDDPYLRDLKLQAQPVFSDFTTSSINSYVYQIVVPDGGGAGALFALNRAYGKNVEIVQESYSNGYSTYKVYAVSGAPAAFTPSTTFSVAACNGVCPAGFTVIPAYDVYTITRPVSGSDNVAPANQATYASTLSAVYTSKTVATSAVDITDNELDITAHGLPTGAAVVYANGGGTSITGLTTATTYYVIAVNANSISLATTRANALAGTEIDISGTGNNAQSITIAGTPSFLSSNGGVASVEIRVPSGTVLPAATLGDNIIYGFTTEAYCQPSAPSAISWTLADSGYTTTRQLSITVRTLDCTEAITDTVADIIASLGSTPSYVAASAVDITGEDDNCIKKFRITQRSKWMKDKCMSPGVAQYDELPSYKQYAWEPIVVTAEYDATIKAGIRISAPLYSISFSDCTFNPNEYWDLKPLKMRISTFEQDGRLCDINSKVKAYQVKAPKYARLYGEGVLRQYIRSSQYFVSMEWDQDARVREVIDNTALAVAPRDKYYVAYYLQFKASKGAENFGKEGEWFEPVIYVEEGDLATQAAVEAALSAITSKWDVFLEPRIG